MELLPGPCSITPENIGEIYKLAEIRVKNLQGRMQRAFWGTRMVELKSRTSLNIEGKGMGIGFPTVMENMLMLAEGRSPENFNIPESVRMMEGVARDTGLVVATEVMMPNVQIPVFERVMPKGKMMLWNPSVEQLGWSILPMAIAARKNDWRLGLKNGKWLGGSLTDAQNPDFAGVTDLEKTWVGLADYAKAMGLKEDNIVLIHRGVNVPERGEFRNLPVHEVARRAKHKVGGRARLYFDPSHTYGPGLRDQIVEGTIKAMIMRDGNGWLYDGALIEVGHSPTDTAQHLSIDEMEQLAREIAKFRDLRGRGDK